MTTTTTTQTQERLIDIVTRLLAKAEANTSTEAEAASYAAKAQELLAKHNLSVEMINASKRADAPKIGETLHEFKYVTPLWMSLFSATAKLYFCEVYSTHAVVEGKFRKVMMLVGKPHNVEIANSMISYLVRTIGRLRRSHSKNRAMQIQFERGCILALCRRLRELREASSKPDPKAANGSGGLPALYETEANEISNYLAAAHPDMKISRRAKVLMTDSARAGAEAAKNISLSPQVDGGKTPSNLLGKH